MRAFLLFLILGMSSLHQSGAATIYVADVPPGSRDFPAVQWWGTLGGLHELPGLNIPCGHRGANITGQYYEAFPGHTVRLEQQLDKRLYDRWSRMLADVGLDKIPYREDLTRGDFIRQAFERYRSKQ